MRFNDFLHVYVCMSMYVTMYVLVLPNCTKKLTIPSGAEDGWSYRDSDGLPPLFMGNPLKVGC